MNRKTLNLIGLHGLAGCGKDTIAEFICDIKSFRRISFADPIRQAIIAMFKIPRNYLFDRAYKEKPLAELCGKSPRQVMQTLGTEWGRKYISQDIWLKVAERQMARTILLVEAGKAYIDGIVITDIRFPDEAQWLRNQGGTIWHIRRPHNKDSTESNHVSEIPLTPKNGEPIIINDGDLDQLREKIAQLIAPSYKVTT